MRRERQTIEGGENITGREKKNGAYREQKGGVVERQVHREKRLKEKGEKISNEQDVNSKIVPDAVWYLNGSSRESLVKSHVKF